MSGKIPISPHAVYAFEQGFFVVLLAVEIPEIDVGHKHVLELQAPEGWITAKNPMGSSMNFSPVPTRILFHLTVRAFLVCLSSFSMCFLLLDSRSYTRDLFSIFVSLVNTVIG